MKFCFLGAGALGSAIGGTLARNAGTRRSNQSRGFDFY